MQWFSNCKFIGSKTPLRLNLISRFSPICCASFIKLWKVNTTERPMKNLEKRNSLLVAVTPARRTYNVLGLLAGLGLALGAAESARASVGIANYPFLGNPGELTLGGHNPNVTGTSVSLGGGTSQGSDLTGSLDLNIEASTTTELDAVDNDSYLELTVTPNAGYEMNLTALTFYADSSNMVVPDME